ncbi:MAG: glycoside hydrolase family 55 protein [Bdellovibrionaceae bacterium]|nr:glycoside hydrolase family 55 protein [Pseudobdellovibrionaceae bacterium]
MKFFLVLLCVFVFAAEANSQITRDEILDPEIPLLEFSVKKWGATGDGETDDYASIQTAIKAQESSGKVILYFPPGRYKVSQTIRVSAPKESFHKFKFLIQGAGVRATEVFVTDKNKDTFYIEGRSDKDYAQGLFSDLTLGPERSKEDLGWPLQVKKVQKSVFKKFATKGSKCSVRNTGEGGGNSFNFDPGRVGKSARSGCLEF